MSDNNFNNFLNEAFINPIHGKHGKEKQMEQIIHNNVIIYNYINAIWNNFISYFNKN